MNPAADIWAKVLALMQNEMTTTTINTWFDDTTAVELEGDRFVLYSPTPFKRDIIASRYLPAIQNALRELFSAEFQVTVLTEGELDRYQQPKKNDLIPGTEEYTFERFVVGSSNKFAHAAARAVEAAGRVCMKPCVLMETVCDYAQYGRLLPYIAASGGTVEDTAFAEGVSLCFRLPEDESARFEKGLADLTAGTVSARVTGHRHVAYPVDPAGK